MDSTRSGAAYRLILGFLLLSVAASRPGQAQVVRQITNQVVDGSGSNPALDDAGTAVYIVSNTLQLGGNPQGRSQIFRFDAAAGTGQQVTNFRKGVSGVSVSDDGQWLAFDSRSDLIGQNHDESSEIFVMRSDGTGLAQLTNDPAVNAGNSGTPALSGSANRLAFLSSSDLLGTNGTHKFQLFVVNFDGSGLRQLTTSTVSGISGPISISDDGDRIVFRSSADLTGGNADGSFEVFAIQADGTSLRQITSSSASSQGGVISGNGSKIAFHSTGNLSGTNADASSEVFVIDWDGTNLRQLTSSTNPNTRSSSDPSITDDGQFVVFDSNESSGSLNADHSNEIWRIKTDGTGLTLLTSYTVNPPVFRYPVVAGGGGRIALLPSCSTSTPCAIPGWNNPDGGPEQFVMAGDGTNMRQLTITRAAAYGLDPDITRDGSRIVYSSDANPLGTNPDGSKEIFRIQSDGTGLAQVTSFPDEEADSPSISADGQTIVFSSDVDPLGQNADGSYEIFLIHADGTGLRQLTSGSSDSYKPEISANNGGGPCACVGGPSPGSPCTADFPDCSGRCTGGGQPGETCDSNDVYACQGRCSITTSIRCASDDFCPDVETCSPQGTCSSNGVCQGPGISCTYVIVFYTQSNLTGGNPDSSYEVFSVKPDGSDLRQLTSSPLHFASYSPRVDDSGTWVVFSSSANLDGTSPTGQYQVFRIRTDGTGLQRVSPDLLHYAIFPDVSASGTRITYMSQGDPLGSNPAHHAEVFVYDTGTGTTRQLSAGTPSGPGAQGAAYFPAITGDGAYVYFTSNEYLDEFDPSLDLDLYRAPTAPGPVERIGALRARGSFAYEGPQTDMTGSRVVFNDITNTTEENPDGSDEVFLIDLTRAPRIRVGKSAPTLVSWDHEAGPIRYDVVRGDVASLHPGSGGTVNLGPVVCLEDDSPDADTFGHEDVLQPSPGHALFYLFRGSRGLNYGPGSWGQGTAGAERIPASGDCTP